jgi:hypothetical protein
MLDVHPPHHPTHTWKDFFIHIATICVGLLIAVALEQSVEALNRRHEATELREILKAESAQILADSRRTEKAQIYQLDWLAARLKQVRAAVWDGRKLEAAAPDRQPYFASPDIPLWRAAKESGQAKLLSKGEINGFSEVQYVQTRAEILDRDRDLAEGDLRRFQARFPDGDDGAPDWSRASPEDLRIYLGLLTAEIDATTKYLIWIRLLIGAETSIQAGRTALEDIYSAERKASGSEDTMDPNAIRPATF